MTHNISKFLVAFCVTIALTASQSPAQELSFVPDIPAEILFGPANANGPQEGPNGSANSQSAFGFRPGDEEGEEGTSGRGQSFLFSTGDGLTHNIGGLTVSLNAPLDDAGFRPDGQIELTVFQWDSNDPDNVDNWNSSTGGEFTTGHNELFRGSFDILSTDSWTGGDLLQIAFAPGQLQLTDGTAYGFFFRYTLDSLVDAAGDPLDEDVSVAFDTRQDTFVLGGVPEDGFPGRVLSTNEATSFEMATNVAGGDRDMNFFFTAGEPGADVLGDFDGNGVVDCADLDGYFGNLGTSVAGMTGGLTNLDINLDDTITVEDAEEAVLTLVVTTNGITGTFLGDFNCDGTVDILDDAFALIANLNGPATSFSQGDANFDGTIDILNDAFTLIENLGNTNEPTVIALP